MNKRIIILHRWSGSPKSDWYPWAKAQLATRGYDVLVPSMPDPDAPKIQSWMATLKETVDPINETDIFIGHSVGCQTILRFLEQLPESKKVDKVILVAPWYTLTNLSNPTAEEIAKPWIETSIDFAKVKQKANEFITIFSDNDPYVPYEKTKAYFQKKLNPEIITEHNKGHLTQDDDVTQLPVLLNAF